MRSFCLIIFICFLSSLNADGQYESKTRPFSVVIDAGPALQQTPTGGGVIEINPGYMIVGRYRAGFQFAWAGFDENTVASWILTFDYFYFQNRHFRLSIGGGYGLYTNSYYGSQGFLPMGETLNYLTTGRTGGNIRTGLEWNHLSFRIAYHIAPSLYKYEYDYGLPPGISVFKGNYLGLTLGIRIGGWK
jgi:hypothetical protein